MSAEPIQPNPTMTTFVYDTRSGRIVHVHQFIPASPGGRISDREMAEAALAQASAGRDKTHLAVLHGAKDVELDPGHRYRVDLQHRRLVVEPDPAASRRPGQRASHPAT